MLQTFCLTPIIASSLIVASVFNNERILFPGAAPLRQVRNKTEEPPVGEDMIDMYGTTSSASRDDDSHHHCFHVSPGHELSRLASLLMWNHECLVCQVPSAARIFSNLYKSFIIDRSFGLQQQQDSLFSMAHLPLSSLSSTLSSSMSFWPSEDWPTTPRGYAAACSCGSLSAVHVAINFVP